MSEDIFAFSTIPEKVGIITAASTAITAMTMTSSTIVNPLLFNCYSSNATVQISLKLRFMLDRVIMLVSLL